jgi:hypothetical protein
MNEDIMALLAGAALAIAALAYVLQPLFTSDRRTMSRPVAIPEDQIEARVRALRERHPTCDSCGVRPEPDATYCSNCGRALDASSARSC